MSQMSQGGFHSAQSVVRPWGSSTLSASIPGTPAMPIHGNGAQMHDAHANTTLADLATTAAAAARPIAPASNMSEGLFTSHSEAGRSSEDAGSHAAERVELSLIHI